MTSRHALAVKVKKHASPQQCRESNVLNTVMRQTAFSPSELSESAGSPQGERQERTKAADSCSEPEPGRRQQFQL